MQLLRQTASRKLIKSFACAEASEYLQLESRAPKRKRRCLRETDRRWHVITLQEASEYVDHDILTHRFHVTHYVNGTPYMSHFLSDAQVIYTHTRSSSRKFSFAHYMPCAHVACLILFDFSTLFSLLSIISLVILSFLLAINFILHDVGDKFPVQSR